MMGEDEMVKEGVNLLFRLGEAMRCLLVLVEGLCVSFLFMYSYNVFLPKGRLSSKKIRRKQKILP
jgi:hypothetical protein